MKRIVVVVLAFAGLAFGQDLDTQKTDGRLNCRWWNASKPETTLIGVLIGHMQMWSFARADIMLWNIPFPTQPNGFPALPSFNDVTIGEMKDGVSAVCSRPENARLVFFEAMILFGEKLSGWSDLQVETLAIQFRKRATSKVETAPQYPHARPSDPKPPDFPPPMPLPPPTIH